jgi:hypothetical protein
MGLNYDGLTVWAADMVRGARGRLPPLGSPNRPSAARRGAGRRGRRGQNAQLTHDSCPPTQPAPPHTHTHTHPQSPNPTIEVARTTPGPAHPRSRRSRAALGTSKPPPLPPPPLPPVIDPWAHNAAQPSKPAPKGECKVPYSAPHTPASRTNCRPGASYTPPRPGEHINCGSLAPPPPPPPHPDPILPHIHPLCTYLHSHCLLQGPP